MLGSVATSVATAERHYDECFWWLLVDEESVVGLAMRTSPHGMVISPLDEPGAVALGRVVAREDPLVPSLAGPAHVVAHVLRGLHEAGAGRAGRVTRRDNVYTVDTLRPPVVPGVARRAGDADEDLVVEWQRQFHEELDLPHFRADDAVARVRAGAVDLWNVNGVSVSLAGHAVATDAAGTRVTRVGPVYTPEAERGHGYAAAVTAALTRRLLDDGSRVMLYADADNPTSNGVYQRLGYDLCADVVIHEFD